MNENNNNKEENVFGDLVKMEDEVINEALDLVEEALSLVDSRQYNEGIHYLRQALGLYRQIGRTNEINAIRHKISEIYILKEQQIEENEIDIALEDSEVKDIEKLKVQKEFAEILARSPEELIEEAEKIMDIREFDTALEFYDVAIKKYREINNESEIERVYDLIDQCYDAKAKFLIRPEIEVSKEVIGPEKEVPKEVIGPEKEVSKEVIRPEKEVSKEVIRPEKEVSKEAIKIEAIKGTQEPLSAVIEKKDKLKLYEEMKEKETKISNQAYEILEKASELMKILDFDKASELYNKALELFKEINWRHEIQKIQETLEEIKKEKEILLKKLEVKKKEKKEIELKTENAIHIDEKAKQINIQKERERFKRLTELEKKKQEEEQFHRHISELVDEAEILNLNYEQDKKKAIKEKKLLELESPFNKIIEIYEKIRSMLLERKWTDQTRIYSDQIKLYYEKLEKDKKLREVEAKKRERDKAYLESLKITKEDVVEGEKLKVTDEKIRKEVDDEILKKQISELVDTAEKMSREYDIEIKKAIKKGQLDIDSVYPDIIAIYENVRDRLLERDWTNQAKIYIRQIQIYQDKLEKDKKLREIEDQKIQKQKEYEEHLKVKKREAALIANLYKSKLDKEKFEKEYDLEVAQKKVSNMVDEAIKIAREYEFAIRRGLQSEDQSTYLRVIEIFKKARKMVLEHGLKDQAEIYTKQIQLYQNKLKSIKNR